MTMETAAPRPDTAALADRIKAWARELGFQQAGIAEPDLEVPHPGLGARSFWRDQLLELGRAP